MSSSPTDRPEYDPAGDLPQAASFDVILAQSRNLVCESLARAFASMLDKADESLYTLVDESRDQDVQKRYREIRDKVLAQRESLEKQFRNRYQAEFQKRSNRVKKIGDSFSELDLSSVELELVGEDDLNESIKFNDMATRLRRYSEEELVALDQRVGVLLGDASLQEEDNPFTPQAICDAYKQTCRVFDPNVEVRMILLKMFDDHVLDDIRAIYKAVNALLVQNSILPKIRHAPARQERAKPPAAGTGAETPGAVGEQDLFSVLQNLIVTNLNAMAQAGVAGGTGLPAQGAVAIPGFPPIGGMPGAASGGDGPRPILQGAELLGSLTRIQQGDVNAVPGINLPLATAIGEAGMTANVLRELKSTSLGSGMNQLDIMTLDIVAMLFDQLFDDPKIPGAVKGLIGRLQIPMLKVAIADKTLFSRKSHPARQLLDTLGEFSARLPADFDTSSALFERMQAVIWELIKGFEDNIEIFDVVRGKIQQLIAEEDQRAEQQTQTTANLIDQKEILALAKTVAQAEIKVRIRFGKLPREVLEFLVQQWIKFLMVVHVKEGEDSDEWKHALETMDRLLWSLEPKNTVDERRELVKKVPDLLKRLTEGLKGAGVEDDIRKQFFSDLRKLHADILDRGAKSRTEAVPDASVAVPTAPSEAAPAMESAPATHQAIQLEPMPADPLADTVPIRPITTESTPAEPTPIEPSPVESAPAAPKPAEPIAAEPVPADLPKQELPEFTAAITVNNPFGGGEVQVDDLDFTVRPGAGTAQGAQGAKEIELPGDLKVGSWVRIREKGEKESGQQARLSFISPLKTRYLFVDRQGKTVLECSATELASRFHSGKVVIEAQAAETPLFDRIMGGVVGKLRAPATPSSAKR